MNKRKAFTLVELLVVISIIALLVGILLPALSRARDAAMVNSSKNNIRNIYMANANYNAANKGRQWTGAPCIFSFTKPTKRSWSSPLSPRRSALRLCTSC